MAVHIKRMNPGSEWASQAEWELPCKFPLTSRIEIHDTEDAGLPYEFRLIVVKEPSAQDELIRNLFVDVVIQNCTRNQDFDVVFGKTIGKVTSVRVGKTCHARINRGITTHISAQKLDALTKQERVDLEYMGDNILESHGSRAFFDTARAVGRYISYFIATVFILSAVRYWRSINHT